MLDRLGLWRAFLGEGHETCFGSCSAWGSAALGFNDFILNPHGAGWHLDRARFDGFLRRRAGEADVTRYEARVTGATLDGDDGCDLRLVAWNDEAHALRARFVVDATGRAAAIARQVGARQIPLDRLTFVYGYGIHKALADGIESAELIAAAFARGGDLWPDHADLLNTRVDEYVINRNYFYGLERRWPTSEFWRRRRARRNFAATA